MFGKAKNFLILFMEASSAGIILQNIRTFCTLPLRLNFFKPLLSSNIGYFMTTAVNVICAIKPY